MARSGAASSRAMSCRPRASRSRTVASGGPISHTSLAYGSVQAARIFSSDAVIAQDHFVVLTDPKDFQAWTELGTVHL